MTAFYRKCKTAGCLVDEGMRRAFCRVKDAVAGIDGLSAQAAEIRRLGCENARKKVKSIWPLSVVVGMVAFLPAFFYF